MPGYLRSLRNFSDISRVAEDFMKSMTQKPGDGEGEDRHRGHRALADFPRVSEALEPETYYVCLPFSLGKSLKGACVLCS